MAFASDPVKSGWDAEVHRSGYSLPAPWLARHATCGFWPLVADYFWIQANHYFSVDANRKEWFRFLVDYVHLVTSIDPDFKPAYLYGGIALPVYLGSGIWANLKASTEILDAGAQRFPDDWRLPLYSAFNQSLLRDHLGAAERLGRCARIPGCPPYAGPLAARMLASSGRVDAALELTQSLLDSTTEPETRKLLERRLRQLQRSESLPVYQPPMVPPARNAGQ